jgi:transcriptional regulator with XRE-family HTH domain
LLSRPSQINDIYKLLMQEILSKKEIGERIKDLRVKNGLSQAIIANILNLSRSNYSQIELGNQYPSFHTLHEIARYYNRTYDWLLHGADNKSDNENPAKIDLILSDLETSFRSFTISLKKLEQELNHIKSRRDKARI